MWAIREEGQGLGREADKPWCDSSLVPPAPQEARQRVREGKPGRLLCVLVSLCFSLHGGKERRGDS